MNNLIKKRPVIGKEDWSVLKYVRDVFYKNLWNTDLRDRRDPQGWRQAVFLPQAGRAFPGHEAKIHTNLRKCL